MFDIDFSQPTWETFIAIHVYFIILIVIYWKRYTSEHEESTQSRWFELLFLLYCIFAFDGGDFYNYYLLIREDSLEHMEPVYHIIVHAVNNNYILFRLIVWGGALFFFKKAVKRFNLDYNRSLFFLFAVFISVFDYARASLAMSIFFYGLSLVLLPGINKIGSYFLGLLLMITSVFFHNSMIIALAASLLLFVPINGFTIVLIIISFSLASSIFAPALQNLVDAELFTDSLNEKIEGYSLQEYQDSFSIYEWIRRYMRYATFFIPYLIVAIKIYFKTIEIPTYIRRLSAIVLGFLLLAISVLLIPNLTFVLFYRILFMSMIPILIIFCYFEQNCLISNKTYKFILYLGITSFLFGFVKRVIGGNLA
ncbi:MAG: EpsG family protein [Bacteroidales bacterium]|nr:EpsG family protein [Bacteroidales bacterium]